MRSKVIDRKWQRQKELRQRKRKRSNHTLFADNSIFGREKKNKKKNGVNKEEWDKPVEKENKNHHDKWTENNKTKLQYLSCLEKKDCFFFCSILPLLIYVIHPTQYHIGRNKSKNISFGLIWIGFLWKGHTHTRTHRRKKESNTYPKKEISK